MRLFCRHEAVEGDLGCTSPDPRGVQGVPGTRDWLLWSSRGLGGAVYVFLFFGFGLEYRIEISHVDAMYKGLVKFKNKYGRKVQEK